MYIERRLSRHATPSYAEPYRVHNGMGEKMKAQERASGHWAHLHMCRVCRVRFSSFDWRWQRYLSRSYVIHDQWSARDCTYVATYTWQDRPRIHNILNVVCAVNRCPSSVCVCFFCAMCFRWSKMQTERPVDERYRRREQRNGRERQKKMTNQKKMFNLTGPSSLTPSPLLRPSTDGLSSIQIIFSLRNC